MRMRLNTKTAMTGRCTQTLLLSFCIFCLLSLVGCDAFVRKFTRKSKKEKLPAEEMVLVPEEYKGPQMTKEELYRQYFLYWQSWQDELISALSGSVSHKKQISCAVEAIKNIEQVRSMLNAEKQKRLDIYIGQLKSLKEIIAGDLYGSDLERNRLNAERMRRDILREFSYSKIKNCLI